MMSDIYYKNETQKHNPKNDLLRPKVKKYFYIDCFFNKIEINAKI